MSDKKTKSEKVETAKKLKIMPFWVIYICIIALLGFVVFALLPPNFKFENLFNNTQNNPTNSDQAVNPPDSDISNPSTPNNQTTQTKIDLNSTQYFSGRIDNKNVSMVLKIADSTVNGFYSYDHYNAPIKLTGTVEKTLENSSAIKLDEYINEQKNASFELNMERQDPTSSDVSLIGKWSSQSPEKTLDVLMYTTFLENIHLSSAKPNDIEISAEINDEYQDLYSIIYTYPAISNLPDTKIQEDINKSLAQFSDLTQTKKDFEDLLKEESRVAEDPNFSGYSDEIDYHINYNQNNILSVEFSGYNYTGGAHGSPFVSTLNFDLKTAKELKLSDIFKADSKYLDYFSSDSRTKLNQKFSGTSLPEYFSEGLAPKEENFENWSFTPKGGINITFGAYQVAAFAYGTPTIHFSAEDLKDFLKPEYQFPTTQLQI